MAYELLNGTRKCGEFKALEPNANRSLPSRPPPESWEPFQPTESKRNKRERLNATSIENPSKALPIGLKTSENSAVLRHSPYKNLPFIMDPSSPFINASSINNSVSLSPSSIICTNQTYLNVPPLIYSSRTDYSYSYSNTFIPIPSNFYFHYQNKLQVTLFIFSFKPRQIHRPIDYSYLSSRIC